MASRFDEFIKTQSGIANDGEKGFSVEREKELWLQKLRELYLIVNDSLKDYIHGGTVTLKYSEMELYEEQLGAYRVQKAEVVVGRQVVHLKPIGTFLIGARGRVDMIGPKGATRFVIVPPGSVKPQISVRVSINGSGFAEDAPAYVPPPETWVWKISTLPPQITYIDLTVDSFREALIGVVNG